ncbi:hypothetical protein [Streptomyces sp. NBC_01190]|uniref:hypothetical protein n=1 Tax=Streptomyces sp. NBC_01190 TaxID=2903767 RepID=UPI003867A13E|nr:hypothetical protein OG519_28120 [Streptomyces sp. NBC_01190]
MATTEATRSRWASTLAAAVAAAAALAVVTGCAGGDATQPGRDPGAPAPSASASASTSASATPSACGDRVIAGGTDSTTCLRVGSVLRLRLGQDDGAAEHGAALKEVSPGVYLGVLKGRAEVSGSHRVCPKPGPGEVSCDAIRQWTVTVDVR